MGCTPSKNAASRPKHPKSAISLYDDENGHSDMFKKTNNNNNRNGNYNNNNNNKNAVIPPPTSTDNLLKTLNPVVALQGVASKQQQNIAQFAKRTNMMKAHHLRNIFAIPMEADTMSSFKLPEFPKSDEEQKFLQEALTNNVFFEHLSEKEMTPLIKAFELIEIPNGDVVIEQGSVGDYFYILYSGRVFFMVNDAIVGKPVGKGAAFGELALLYACPRAATVTTSEDCTVFRVDQQTFRYILQVQSERAVNNKFEMLKKVPFLANLSKGDLTKLANAMTPINFTVGTVMAKKGDDADHFAVVEEGRLAITDIGDESTAFEDLELNPGDHYGEYVVVPGKKRAANIYGLTDGRVFIIKRETFQQVLGNLDQAIMRSLDKRFLRGLKIFKDTNLDSPMYNSLTALVKDQTFKASEKIVEAGKEYPAALFMIRKGKLLLGEQNSGKQRELITGDYFGEDVMLLDAKRGRNGPKDSIYTVYNYTITAIEDCSLGFLTLENCRRVFDTTQMGRGKRTNRGSIVQNNLQVKDFEKHTLLGAGTFGHVWLVSRVTSAGIKATYALKVQSKFELCKSGQAKSVVYEKSIMAQLKHPFLGNLCATYKDNDFVYMLMDFIQGGELFSIMNKNSDKLPEKNACFYFAGIAEGLAYMHRRGFVYRDLKPENVLINEKGYPIIVDFGFAKYVPNLTYTLCGTPLYLPPEVILNKGHNAAADHYSMGILLYEMVSGSTPFYKSGMDQLQLFRAIVQCHWELPSNISMDCDDILRALIVKQPSQRLGSLANGEEDLLSHVFFKDIDFNKLRVLEIPAPYIPKVSDPLDASSFNDWSHLDDKMNMRFPAISEQEEKIFEAF